MKSSVLESRVFTTGQVAKRCKVAPRTVSKWFDSGRLQGYRIPGSEDRRVPEASLRRFLLASGMPLGDLDDSAVLLVSDDGVLQDRLEQAGQKVLVATSTFDAGRLFGARAYLSTLIVDTRVPDAVLLPAALNGDRPPVVIAIDDVDGRAGDVDERFDRPFDPQLLVECLLRRLTSSA